MPESTSESWWSWQRVFILSAGLLICAFVAGVFWQVLQSVPEIGLHTTLRNVVNRADPEDLRTADGQPNPDFRETLREASYVEIGDEPIATYPQRLDAIGRLDGIHFTEKNDLAAGGRDNYVHWDGADWVRVRSKLRISLEPRLPSGAG